jgi:hypothetical protein
MFYTKSRLNSMQGHTWRGVVGGWWWLQFDGPPEIQTDAKKLLVLSKSITG